LKKNDINEEEEHYFETDYYYKIDQNLEDESIANKQLNDLEIELEQDASLNKAALDNIEHNSPILERELLTTEHELENIKSRLEMNETVSAVTQSVLDSIRSEYNLPESKDEEEEEYHPNSSSNEEYNDYREEKEQEQKIINEEEEEIVLDAESIKQAEKCMMVHQLDENEEIEVEEVEEENVDKSLLYSSSAAENEDFKDSNLIKIENLQTHRKLSISQTNLIENSESDLETKPGVSILVDEENDTQQMINSLTKTTQYQTFESSSSTNSDLYKQEDFHDDSDSKKLNKQIEKKSDDDDDDDNDDHGFNRSHQRSSRVKRKSKSSSTRNSPKENIDPINTISESSKIIKSIQNQEISYSSGEVSSKSVDDLIKIDKTYLNNESNNQTKFIETTQQQQQQETNMLNVTKTGITGSESREFLLQDEDNDEESSSLNTSNLTVMQTINPIMEEEEEKIKQNEFSSEMSASEDERNIKSDLAIETVNLIYSSDGSSEPETSATATNNLVSSDLITLVQAAAADTVSKVYLTLDENNQNENNNNSTQDINLKGLRHASTDCSNCSLISSNIGSQNEVNLIQNEEIRSSIESMNEDQEILNSNISKSLNYLESLVFSSNNAIITEQEKDNNVLTDDIIKLSKHIEDIIDDDLSIIKSSKSLTFNRPASFKTHGNENELFSKQRSDQFEQEQQTPTPVENIAGDFFDKRITSSNEPSIDYLVNLTVQHDDDEVIQQEINDNNDDQDQEEVAAAVATALLFSSKVVSTDEFENQNYEQTDEKFIKDATPRQFTKYIVLGSDNTTKLPEQEETSSFIESEEKDEEYIAAQTSTTGIENPCFIDSNNEETSKLKSNSSSISTSNESMIVNQEYDDTQDQLNIKMKINTDIIVNEIKNTEQFRSEINDLIEKAEEEQTKPLILDNINDEEEEEGVVIGTQKNDQNLIDEQTFLIATPTPSNQSPLVDKNVNFITSTTEQMDKAVELVEQTLNKSIEFIQTIKVETPQNSPESKTNENSSNSSSSSNTFDNIFEKALDQMSHESSDKEAKIQAQLIVDEAVLKAIKSNSDRVDTIVNESTVFNTELIADSQLLVDDFIATEIEINYDQLVKENETKTSNELVSDSKLIVENAEQLVKDEEETKTSNELVLDSQLLVDDCIAKAIEINSKELQLDSKILVENIVGKAIEINAEKSVEENEEETKTSDELSSESQLLVENDDAKAIEINSQQLLKENEQETKKSDEIVSDSQLLVDDCIAKEIEINAEKSVEENEEETKTSDELSSESQLLVENDDAKAIEINSQQLLKENEQETKKSDEIVSDSQLLVDDCIAKEIEINAEKSVEEDEEEAKKPDEIVSDSQLLVENADAKAIEINSEQLLKEDEEEAKKPDEIVSDSQLLIENADAKAIEINSEQLLKEDEEEAKKPDEIVSDSQLLVENADAKAIEINSEQLLKEDEEEAKKPDEIVSDSQLLVDAEELAVEAKVLIDNVLEKALKTVKTELSDDDEEEDDDKKKKKKKHDDNQKDKNIFKKKDDDDDDDDDNDNNTKRPDSRNNEAYSSELVSTETTNLQVTEQNKDEHLEETEDLTTVLVQPDEQNIIVVQEVEENNPLLTSSFMSSNGNLPKELNTTDLENSFDLCDNLTIYNSATTDDDNSDDFEDEDRFSNKTLNLDVTNLSQSVTPNNLKSSASSTTSSYHTAYTTAASTTNSEIINKKKQQYINSKELRSSGGSATQTISSSNYMTAVDEMSSLKKSNSQNITSSESFYSVSDTSFKSESRKNSINNNSNKKHNKSIDTSFSSSTYSGNGLANLSSLESSYSDSNENNDLLTPNLTLESDDDTDLDADLVSFGNEQIQSAESKQFGNFNVEYFLKNMYPLNNFQTNNESNKTIESSSHNSTLTDDEEQKQNKTKENFTFIHKEDLPDLGSSSKLISDDNEFIITEPDIKIEPQTNLEEDKIETKLNKTESPQLLLSSPVYEKKIIISNNEGGVSSNAGSSASGSGDNVSYTSSVLEFENLEMQYTIEQFDQDNSSNNNTNNNNNNNEDSILVYNYDENLKNNNYDMMISHDLNTIYESSSVDENESIPEVNPKSPELINDSLSSNNNTKKMNNQNLSLNFFQIETSKAYEKPINVTFNKASTSLNNSPLGSPSLLKSMNRMSQTPDRESSSAGAAAAFLISKTNTSRSSSSSSIKSTDSFENELKCKFKIDENSYFAKKQLEKKNLVKLEEIIVDPPQQQRLTTTKTNDSIDSAITNNARSTDSGQSSMNDILNMANQLTSPESENNSFLNRLNNDSFSSPLSSLTTSYMSDLGALANIVSPTTTTSQNDESFKQQQSSCTSTVFNAEDLSSFRKMSSPISFNSINEKSFATKPVHLIPTSSSTSNIDQKLFNFNSNTNITTTIITTNTNTTSAGGGGGVVASSSSSSASNSNETKLKKTNNSNPNLSNSHHSSSSLSSSSHHSSNCYCGKQKTTSDYTISTSTTQQPVIQLTNKQQEGNI
jgi:trimeric autotransporter adhesin